MIVNFYNNESDNNVLNKNITLINNKDVKLKNDTNILNPVLLISGVINPMINYIGIPDFNRFYYINNIRSINNDIYEISCKCDVLMSHKNSILNSDALVVSSENLKNDYISSDVYVNDVREKTSIINFNNGFNDSPEFVLITAGATII